MPRSRSRRPSTKATPVTPEVPVTTVTPEIPTTTTENTQKGNTIKMAGLSPEEIAALLGNTRTKGVYIKYLNDFVKSGEGGVCVNEQWVDLKDKKATTLKQGFENAKQNKEATDGADNVKVISNEDKVYLLNLAAAGIATEDAEAEVAA